jgi:hypothetical protein
MLEKMFTAKFGIGDKVRVWELELNAHILAVLFEAGDQISYRIKYFHNGQLQDCYVPESMLSAISSSQPPKAAAAPPLVTNRK